MNLATKTTAELHRLLGKKILRIALAATAPDAPPAKWHKDAVRYFQILRDCKASLTLDSDPRP